MFWNRRVKKERPPFHIREASFPPDGNALMYMVEQLAEYEKCLDQVKITADDLNAFLTPAFDQSPFIAYIAEVDGIPVGFALAYKTFSTWVGKGIHLDDIYVEPEHRGKGIGTALFQKILDAGKAERIDRIEWRCLHWNEKAIRFYQKMGAVQLNEEWGLWRLRPNE